MKKKTKRIFCRLKIYHVFDEQPNEKRRRRRRRRKTEHGKGLGM